MRLYEEKIFPRAEKLQRLTVGNKEAMFGRMIETMKGEDPSLVMRVLCLGLVVWVVSAYFWIRVTVGWRQGGGGGGGGGIESSGKSEGIL